MYNMWSLVLWYVFLTHLHAFLFTYMTWFFDREFYYRVIFDRDYQRSLKNRYAPLREPYYHERGVCYRGKEERLKKLEYNRKFNMITEFEYNRDMDKIERELAEEEYAYKETAKHIILQTQEGKLAVKHWYIWAWHWLIPIVEVMVIHLLTR